MPSAARRATIEAAMQTTVDEVRFRDLEIVILDSARRVVAMTALTDDDPIPPGRPTPVSKIGSTIVASIRGYDVTSPLAVSVASARRDVSRDLAPARRCADSRSG